MTVRMRLRTFPSSSPDLEFEIYARGEDGEMWVVYGCNGEVERHPAEISYPKPTIFKKKEDGSSN